jgi:hypothetical protein
MFTLFLGQNGTPGPDLDFDKKPGPECIILMKSLALNAFECIWSLERTNGIS